MSTLPHHVLTETSLASTSNGLRLDASAEEQRVEATADSRPTCPLRLKIGLALALVVTAAWCLFLGWSVLSFCGRVLS